VIGIASPTFCFGEFSKTLEAVSRHFRLWEVLVEVEHSVEKIEPFVAEARDSFDMRLQVHAPMSDVNIGSVYERMRLAAVDDIARTADFCRRAGVDILTIHPGFYLGIAFLSRPSVLSQMKKSLKEISSTSVENSVAIALENMPEGINATCTTAAELVEAIEGTELGICFDMGHANTASQVEAMVEHVERFTNVHLHNNDGTRDQHNIIDQGTADLPEILSSIVRGGYVGNLIIEANDLESGAMSKQVLDRLLE
jgi:sugar phosphate isomerase/epimerase